MRSEASKGTGMVTALAALLLAAPATALADPGVCITSPDREAEAETLHRQATALIESDDGWREAATLLERSATLRAPCDPQVFKALQLAARIYHHNGRITKAEETMLAAAENAVWTGNVLAAAHAYVDAAELALLDGDGLEALRAANRAEMLSFSPLLESKERLSIARRIERGEEARQASR